MSEDFYPFVDSGDPAPSNTHLTGISNQPQSAGGSEIPKDTGYHSNSNVEPRAARISVYDDMLSTPRVIVIEQSDVRTYLEDVTNTVYRTMKEQGGHLSLMIVRELVENFIHARFNEPIISILDNGDTIRFSDQGPGIGDKELAFEFGVTSADRDQKRYIRGTGSGLPMIQQYVENAGGAIAIEDNLGAGTVVTVSVNPERVLEIEQSVSRGAAVRSGHSHIHAREDNAIPSNPQNPTPESAGNIDAYRMPGQGNPPVGSMGYGQYPMQANQYPSGYPAVYPTPAGHPAQQQVAMDMGMNGYSQMQQNVYPHFGNQFSTNPQFYPQPAGTFHLSPIQNTPMGAAQNPYVSERGVLALRFLFENAQGGPTDLSRLYGSSNATWSRELDTLSKTGFVHKPGQKYVLTDMGRSWLENRLNG